MRVAHTWKSGGNAAANSRGSSRRTIVKRPNMRRIDGCPETRLPAHRRGIGMGSEKCDGFLAVLRIVARTLRRNTARKSLTPYIIARGGGYRIGRENRSGRGRLSGVALLCTHTETGPVNTGITH